MSEEENIINIKLIENKNFDDKTVHLTLLELNKLLNSHYRFKTGLGYMKDIKVILEHVLDLKNTKKLQPNDINNIFRWKELCSRYLSALDGMGLNPCELEDMLELINLDITEFRIVSKRQPDLYKNELKEYNLFKEFKKNCVLFKDLEKDKK